MSHLEVLMCMFSMCCVMCMMCSVMAPAYIQKS